MKNNFKIITLFVVIVLTAQISYAQNQFFNNLTVDSLTFVQTRATLNKLPTDRFEKQVYRHEGKELSYRILLPKNYDKRKKYPLVLTFHNSTRIGNDNEAQLEPLARIWLREEIYNQYNCIVIAPQFSVRSSNYVTNENGVLASKPSEDVNLVLELIKSVEQQYQNIDKNRIFLVGYSMGASTAQNILTLAPKLFTGIVTIAAVPDLSNLKSFKDKNIWLIHGKKDTENPYSGSVELYKKIKDNKRVTFTTYSSLDHNNINIPFLLSDEIPKWLFNQRR
jgi:predicted peptidase